MNQIRKSKIRGIQAEYCQRAGLEPSGKTFELTVEMWMDMAAAFGLMVIDDEPEDKPARREIVSCRGLNIMGEYRHD